MDASEDARALVVATGFSTTKAELLRCHHFPAPAPYIFERTSSLLILLTMMFTGLYAVFISVAHNYLFCNSSVYGSDYGTEDQTRMGLISQVLKCQRFTIIRNIGGSIFDSAHISHPVMMLLFVWVPLRAAERLAGKPKLGSDGKVN